MPSAKSRAAKAATAARVAAYNAAAALEPERPVQATGTADIEKLTNISGGAPDFEGRDGRTTSNTVGGALTNTPMPSKPTLPSMLKLNTSPNMGRALAIGAVMMGAHNDNPSDEENVQPMIAASPASTTTSNKVEKGAGYVARPLSPILGNIDNEKNVRAYEFDRQKVKRAGDLAKRKAAKATKTSGGYSGGHSHGGRGATEGTTGDGGRKEAKPRRGSNDMDLDIAEILAEKPVTNIARGIDKDKLDMPDHGGRIEVSLSELVLRQKKPRKVKDDDFEMISPVRPVIALDDLEARDMDMDEPWEHVERDFEQGKKPKDGELSYAAVLLGIAH